MQELLRLDITNNCNLRCKSCQAYAGVTKRDVKYLDFDLFKSRTKGQLDDWKAIQLGNTAEPTIHPDFHKFIDYFQEEFSGKLTIITNGTTLKKYAPLLNRKKCTVGVSLDSINPETYAKIRRGASLENVLSGIDLLDRNLVNVSASFTLMRSNIEEFGSILEFCRENDITMGFQPMSMRAFGTPQGKFISLDHMLENLLFYPDALKKWMEDYAEHLTQVASATKIVNINQCNAHYDNLMMFSDGSSLLCFKKQHPGLETANLREVFFSEAYKEFRDEIDDNRIHCRYCVYNIQCLNSFVDRVEAYFDSNIMNLLKQRNMDFLDIHHPAQTQERILKFIQLLKGKINCIHAEKSGQGYLGVEVNDLEKSVAAALNHKSDLSRLLDGGKTAAKESLSEIYQEFNEKLAFRNIENFIRNNGKKTVIWGASGRFKAKWENFFTQNPLALEFVCFIDSNPAQWGRTIHGLAVRGPDALKEIVPDIVIIASTYVEEISAQIESMLPNEMRNILCAA